jgi:hypothetical protein
VKQLRISPAAVTKALRPWTGPKDGDYARLLKALNTIPR